MLQFAGGFVVGGSLVGFVFYNYLAKAKAALAAAQAGISGVKTALK